MAGAQERRIEVKVITLAGGSRGAEYAVPVALGAALVAYLAYRWRMWQARGRTDIYRQ